MVAVHRHAAFAHGKNKLAIFISHAENTPVISSGTNLFLSDSVMRASLIIAAHNESDRLWRTVASCVETSAGLDCEIVSPDASE